MMTFDCRVGRLFEIRLRDPLTMDDLTTFMPGLRAAIEQHDGPVCAIADWRHVSSFAKDVADTLVWLLRRNNPKVSANGILMPKGNIELEQLMDRVLLEGRNTNRRWFVEVGELMAWLEPKLAPRERERVQQFFEEALKRK